MERRSTLSAPRRARRLAACVVVAPLLLAACASTPRHEPAEEAAAARPVTARALGDSLDLRTRRTSDGAVFLEQSRDHRIALFPGTHVTTVRGVRYETRERVLANGDEVWVAAADAQVLRRMWQQGVRAGPSTSAVGSFGTSAPPRRTVNGATRTGRGAGRLTLDDLPPRPARTTTSSPRRPAAPTSGPTAAERRAWTIPLRRPWQYVVVHHSGTAAGNAAAFHKAHRERGWDGLGYHFVIGNGNKSPDGRVEVGFRWKQQREGAHAGNDLMNQRGVGICLVGDFNKASPTPAQMRSLRRLCDFLSAYCDIPASNLRLHRDFRKTECPGRHFPRSFALRPPASIRGAAHAGHDHRPLPR